MGKENNMVMTADQYVVAELLKVKAELEDARQTINNLTSANTYLTIENIKLETNLKEIRKCFELDASSLSSIYIKSYESDGSYGSIFCWQSDANFQDWLKVLGLEQQYEDLVNGKFPTKETKVDPQPQPAETKESI